MITSSPVLGYSATNIGALTTTFTPPATCTDAAKSIGNQVVLSVSDGLTFPVRQDCNPAVATACFPNGAAYAKIVTDDLSPFVPYYSPAINCPAGWSTIAVADAANKTVSGFLQPSPASDKTVTEDVGYFYGRDFVKHLEDKETLVVCCPSGYTHAAQALFGCQKTIGTKGSFPAITGQCYNANVTADYKTIATLTSDGGYLVQPTEPPVYTTVPLNVSDDAPVLAVVNAIYMVHKDSDKSSAPSMKLGAVSASVLALSLLLTMW